MSIICCIAQKGNCLALWNLHGAEALKSIQLKGATGVDTDRTGDFIVSTGKGVIAKLDSEDGKVTPLHNAKKHRWYNHLTVAT